MNTIGHSKFITTPISSIIEDSNRACVSLGSGIEIHPLGSYIMQTTFLRMTGASEQKLKCLCWEIASFDYEFRYELLRNPLGECSSYQDKKKIFNNICDSLKRYNASVIFSDTEKDDIINTSTTELENQLETSPQSMIFEKEFKEFQKYFVTNPISRTSFCNASRDGNVSFLEKAHQEYYTDYVYRQRNRYAHNLTSYQMNVPTFTQLHNQDCESNNHFRMFSSLILIDGIFMNLFKKFESMKRQHCY